MSREYVLITALKTRDAVAATAEYTLKHEMDYGHVLKGLTRKDIWNVILAGDSDDDPMAVMEHLARSTRVFVNPNKHLWEIRRPGELESVQEDEDLYRVNAIVRSREDRHGDAALKTLVDLYDMGGRVMSVYSGVLWTLDIAAVSLFDARDWARRMVETRHRQEGLLANPHYETVDIL
ncbi:MAG TPA: hypothetical protein PLV45_17520 [bacterium]|nr:hypothetical protein [bacterium]